MKIVFLIILLLSITGITTAQQNVIIKGTVHLKDHSKIKGKLTNSKDNGLFVSAENDTALKYISAADIHSVKVKRNAVTNGLIFGTAIGGLTGYAVGYVTYNSNQSDYINNSDDKQTEQGLLGAVIGAVPGAIVGGIAGSILQ